MKVTLIESRPAMPMTHRSMKEKWPKQANAALHLDREWAVLFIQNIPVIKDGWPTADPHGKVRKGWYFRDSLIDAPHERISYHHLLKSGMNSDEKKVHFFLIEDCEAKQMYDLVRVIRDHLELVL